MNARARIASVPPVAEVHDDESRLELLRQLRGTLDDLAAGRLTHTLEPESDAERWQRVGNYSRRGEWAKSFADRVLAGIGLALASPVLLLIAIAIRLDSRGPAFFRQTRIGRGGRPFRFWKFRGMHVDARERFPELYEYRYGPEEVKELRFHPPLDPRVTRVGRFIRRTSLDELPQLWNVLRGDMSFVGPRPEVPRYVEQYTAGQKRVLALKPGITDLATLEFRNEEELLNTAADTEKFYIEHCLPRKIELNLAYAEKANVWEDIKIIFRTLWPLEAGRKRETMKAESKEQKAESGRGA